MLVNTPLVKIFSLAPSPILGFQIRSLASRFKNNEEITPESGRLFKQNYFYLNRLRQAGIALERQMLPQNSLLFLLRFMYRRADLERNILAHHFEKIPRRLSRRELQIRSQIPSELDDIERFIHNDTRGRPGQ